MIAAFLLTLSCHVVPATATAEQHNECAVMELQRFDNATLEEIQGCADMAEDLLKLDRFGSRCEVLPMAEGGETASLDVLDNVRGQIDDNEPASEALQNHRVRYGGNLMQRIYDQPNYVF
jgi:hypothetical protein